MQKAKANQRLPEAKGGEDCEGETVEIKGRNNFCHKLYCRLWYIYEKPLDFILFFSTAEKQNIFLKKRITFWKT